MSAVNVLEPEVQIREARLGSITGYAGSAEELVRCSRNGTLQENLRSFSQCIGCASSTAFCQLSMILNVAIINHGPIGCSGDFPMFHFVYRVGQEERGIPSTTGKYFSTNIEEKDTIFGATQKLAETIRSVYERVHPEAIFITTSCASGIIGDDVEGVANELSSELGIPVVGCFCEGFKSRIWTTGFDSAFHSILRKIVKPPEKKAKRVNVINFFGSHILDELFNKLGYQVDYVAPFSTISQLERLSEATATIQICSTLGTYIGAVLEKVYGIPEIKSPPAYGVKGSDEWYREIGKVLDKEHEIETYIKNEHERILPLLEEYRTKFRGKTAYVTAGAAHGHAIIALLKELGFEVQSVSLFHHDPVYDNGDPSSDALDFDVKTYGNVKNFHICNKQAFEIFNILNKVKPDILIARHGEMAHSGAKLGIPTFYTDDEQLGFGYQGILNYAQGILESIENRKFLENFSKHSVVPYTKWWLEQDPFTFLGGDSCVKVY